MSRAGTSAALLAAVLVTGAVVGVGSVLHGPAPAPASPGPPAAAPRPVASDPAAEVLAAWDRRRARAWADGDPAGLRRLYTPGSDAGRRDAAMLARWRARGLVVRGLRTEVLALHVLERRAGRLVLAVTDRLRGGYAVEAGGAPTARRPLPADLPTARRVTLRAVAGEWRVSSVRPSASASR